jgi:uncharacterized membrane protein YedE/YeeE
MPSYVAYIVIFAAGAIMQYVWAAWRPEYRNEEIVAHGGLYYTGGLNEDFDVKQPQARDDNYLILVGLFFFVETSDLLQWALANPLFVYLGRRSLSEYFLGTKSMPDERSQRLPH